MTRRLFRPLQRVERPESSPNLMGDPAGKALTFAWVDEVFRSHNPARQAERYRTLLGEYGVPKLPAAF